MFGKDNGASLSTEFAFSVSCAGIVCRIDSKCRKVRHPISFDIQCISRVRLVLTWNRKLHDTFSFSENEISLFELIRIRFIEIPYALPCPQLYYVWHFSYKLLCVILSQWFNMIGKRHALSPSFCLMLLHNDCYHIFAMYDQEVEPFIFLFYFYFM